MFYSKNKSTVYSKVFISPDIHYIGLRTPEERINFALNIIKFMFFKCGQGGFSGFYCVLAIINLWWSFAGSRSSARGARLIQLIASDVTVIQ